MNLICDRLCGDDLCNGELFCCVFGSGWLCFLISSVSDRRGRAMGVVFAVLLASFLINFVAQFWDPLKETAPPPVAASEIQSFSTRIQKAPSSRVLRLPGTVELVTPNEDSEGRSLAMFSVMHYYRPAMIIQQERFPRSDCLFLLLIAVTCLSAAGICFHLAVFVRYDCLFWLLLQWETLNASSSSRSISATALLLVMAGACDQLHRPTLMDFLLMQHAPTVVVIVFLGWLSNRMRLSQFSYAAIALFLVMHILGARYLYSYTPYDKLAEFIFGMGISEFFGFERNHYDRLVHFLWGFLIAIPIQEAERRYLKLSAFASSVLAVEAILATSAAYEILEWWGCSGFCGRLG